MKMKKRLLTLLLVSAMALSLYACGSSNSSNDDSKAETKVEETKVEETTQTDESNSDANDKKDESEEISIDMDKCISDLKSSLPLEPDYTFVQDYYIGVDGKQLTITAVVDDATDPTAALDFADTLVRQLNLYANMQDSSIELGNKDFYGGLYKYYSALVGVSPASQTNNTNNWFVYDAISGGKTMLKLQKQYR